MDRCGGVVIQVIIQPSVASSEFLFVEEKGIVEERQSVAHVEVELTLEINCDSASEEITNLDLDSLASPQSRHPRPGRLAAS